MKSMILGLASAGLLMEAATDTSGAGSGGEAPAPKAKKATEVEIVQIGDRKVEFPGKRRLQKESIFVDGANPAPKSETASFNLGQMPVVRLDFRNGETRDFRIGLGILLRAAAHGIEQKLGDETAGETDIDDMVLAVDELIDRLSSDDPSLWTTQREGGGMAGTSVLLKALAEHSGKPIEKLKEFLKGKSQAEKMALRNSKQLKPIVERLEQEKLAKSANVDTDKLLGDLAAV